MAEKNHNKKQDEGCFVYQPPEPLTAQSVCALVVEWFKRYVQQEHPGMTVEISRARAARDHEIAMCDGEVWRAYVEGVTNNGLPLKAELQLMQTDFIMTLPRKPVPEIYLLSLKGI